MNTILITGANRGIGLELARQYSAKKWRVFACSRNLSMATTLHELAFLYPKTVIPTELDVTEESSISRLAKLLDGEPIDILMNNAGVMSSKPDHFGTIRHNDWLNTFRVNTIAPLLLSQALFENIAISKLKVIVNMSSDMGSISGNEYGGGYIYRGSKAALNAITKSLSVDLRNKKIISISLHPGWVLTDMGGDNAKMTPEKSVQKIIKILSDLCLEDSGYFINYDGVKLSW